MSVRKLKEKIMLGLITLLAVLSAAPLFIIIINVYREGLRHISLNFLIDLPPPPIGDEPGGIGPALVGSAVLVFLALVIGGGVGFFTGLFLSEFSYTRLAHYTQLALQIMVEFPTIIIGLFAYTVLVVPLGRFNALAGAFALAVVIMPYVALHVKEAYSAIPYSLKEAAFSLGISSVKAYLEVLLSVARRGLSTAFLIGLARAAGETAPLLFTVLGATFTYYEGIDQPVNAIPLLIYNFALSPSEKWHQVAWGAAAVLLTMILAIFIATRRMVKEVKV